MNHSSDNGTTVYSARNLYNIYTVTTALPIYPFYDDCNNSGLYKTDPTSEVVNSDNDIVIYPNPNSGAFYIQFANKTIKSANLKIIDVAGKVLYSCKEDVSMGIIYKDLKFVSGVYLVEIIYNISNKVIKKMIVE